LGQLCWPCVLAADVAGIKRRLQQKKGLVSAHSRQRHMARSSAVRARRGRSMCTEQMCCSRLWCPTPAACSCAWHAKPLAAMAAAAVHGCSTMKGLQMQTCGMQQRRRGQQVS
jgi:hypothetical protein